jgi:hypothetical protein
VRFRFRTDEPVSAAWDMRSIDVDGRVGPIVSALVGPLSTPERILRLCSDPGLSPWLRVFWAMHVQAYEARLRPVLPKIRRSLDVLAASARTSSPLAWGVEGARLNLDIGDKVYAEDVAPRVMTWK